MSYINIGMGDGEDLSLKKFIIKRIEEILNERGWSKKYFAEDVLGKSETWLHNKLKERRKFTFKDYAIITKGLGISQFDLLPNRMKYDIDKMPLTELIKKIVKNEIEHYLKENNLQKK